MHHKHDSKTFVQKPKGQNELSSNGKWNLDIIAFEKRLRNHDWMSVIVS